MHDPTLPYLVINYAAGLAVMLASCRGTGMLGRVNIFYGSIMGLGSLVGTCCAFLALQLLPDAQRIAAFPIILSGQLVLALAQSRVLFREKISAMGYLGVVTQIAGIAVLKLDWSWLLG
jgi:multidrug transporter EmrE-like cation transporter